MARRNPMVKTMIHDLIAELAKRYPNCFVADQWEPHKPFAIGIREALQNDGIELSEREFGRGNNCGPPSKDAGVN